MSEGLAINIKLELDEEPSHPRSFTTADASVRCVLVYKTGMMGAVRITGPRAFYNLVTGPEETGWGIVAVKLGQTCMFIGDPTVRFFRTSCK